jgi:hypothetical protein
MHIHNLRKLRRRRAQRLLDFAISSTCSPAAQWWPARSRCGSAPRRSPAPRAESPLPARKQNRARPAAAAPHPVPGAAPRAAFPWCDCTLSSCTLTLLRAATARTRSKMLLRPRLPRHRVDHHIGLRQRAMHRRRGRPHQFLSVFKGVAPRQASVRSAK